MSDIESKIDTILATAGVTYSAIARGETKRDDWVCDAWSCAFTRTQAIVSGFAPRVGGATAAHEEFDYFTGIGHRKVPMINGRYKRPMSWDNVQGPREEAAWLKANAKPVAPHAAGVLHSIVMDSSATEMSFADWCDEFGYDTDSRKAHATYEGCQQNADKLRRVFTRAQIAELSEALQDY